MTDSLAGKNVLVVGMARSGLAAADLLKKRGAYVKVTEVRPGETLMKEIRFLEDRGISFEAGGHQDRSFLDAELIVISPGIRTEIQPLQKAKERGTAIIGELELASRFLSGKVVAITGTNGKTTTTTLIGELLTNAGYEVQVGGNIGTALSSFVESSAAHTWNVIEVSSFQLELTPTFRPNIAVFLNITPDHLDRYASFDAYFEAKLNLFRNQSPADLAVLNYDDGNLQRISNCIGSGIYWFSSRKKVPRGVFMNADELTWRNGEVQTAILHRSDIPLKGEHNIENVAAASTAAVLAKVLPAQIGQSIRRFRGVEHRLEYSGKIHGVEFYNDSKATNVDAALKAINAFESEIVLILGGRDKGSDFRTLIASIEKHVKCIVLLGEASSKIRSQLGGIVPTEQSTSMTNAVEIAYGKASSHDIVLLAPACASFDLFENYEHRGKEFKKAVNELAARVGVTQHVAKK